MALCAAHVTMACACQAQTMCCAQLSGHWWYRWCAEHQSNNLWKAHHTMGKQEAVGQHVWLPQATPCLASCLALMATFAPTDPCSQPLSRFVACCCCSHRHGTCLCMAAPAIACNCSACAAPNTGMPNVTPALRAASQSGAP